MKLSHLSADIAETFEMEPQLQVYEIDALTTARDSRPIYFQRIYVPAAHYSLNFINSSH